MKAQDLAIVSSDTSNAAASSCISLMRRMPTFHPITKRCARELKTSEAVSRRRKKSSRVLEVGRPRSRDARGAAGGSEEGSAQDAPCAFGRCWAWHARGALHDREGGFADHRKRRRGPSGHGAVATLMRHLRKAYAPACRSPRTRSQSGLRLHSLAHQDKIAGWCTPRERPSGVGCCRLPGCCSLASRPQAGSVMLSPPTLSGSQPASLLVPALIGAVFAAVYHAEDVAHITGEPIGTLVLTIAVTVIELALIVSLMLTGKATADAGARYRLAVILIVTTEFVGLCILVGGLRFTASKRSTSPRRKLSRDADRADDVTIILPEHSGFRPREYFYSEIQLVFISIATVALYLVFLSRRPCCIATISPASATRRRKCRREKANCSPHRSSYVWRWWPSCCSPNSVAVVISAGVSAIGAPAGVTGVIIALIVLTPEAIAAVTAASRDNLQKSLNLALGSSLATIGLTIPAIAAANIILQKPLILGLEPRDLALVVMTLAASILTFGTGRTNVLFGFLHLRDLRDVSFLRFCPVTSR